MINGLIVLSTIGFSYFSFRKAKNGRKWTNRLFGLTVLTTGLGYVIDQVFRKRKTSRCDDDREIAVRRCREYEDRGYAACARYEESGYQTCTKYEDRGYQACSEYEDRGYNSCAEWKKNCCDWWPCSWACEIISWFCVAWVWVSNLVCVAWVWVSNLVCVAWTWVTTFVCRAWYWVTNLVCVAWAVITYPLCVLICAIRRLFAGNEVSFSRSECIYGWTAAYRIVEESDCRLHVEVRIRLVPDADVTDQQLQNTMNVWEPAIEQAWTDRFALLLSRGGCQCQEYHLTTFDVQWVQAGEHHTVAVHSGNGRADMGNWFINNTGGTTAHEVGHMIGNVDEYPDANCPNRVLSNDNSIMRDSQNGVARPRHYQTFATWISSRTCCDYNVDTSG